MSRYISIFFSFISINKTENWRWMGIKRVRIKRNERILTFLYLKKYVYIFLFSSSVVCLPMFFVSINLVALDKGLRTNLSEKEKNICASIDKRERKTGNMMKIIRKFSIDRHIYTFRTPPWMNDKRFQLTVANRTWTM